MKRQQTDFFVPVQPEDLGQVNDPARRVEIDVLAIGKRIGLSFAEMNELRIVDLFDLAKTYAGSKDEGPRMATQADIDAFYRG